MNVAKHIFTLVMGVSIGAMAQTETAPDSLAATAVPDSVPVQPVAENVEVAPVGNAPADSAVVDSTVETGRDGMRSTSTTASALRFMKSGTPFAWWSARSASAANAGAMPADGTMRSAPEMCLPDCDARILTLKRRSSMFF